MVVYLVFLKFADVKDANVVEPLAAVKPAEDEELLGSNDTSSVSLAASWGLFELERMAPAHGLCIQNI